MTPAGRFYAASLGTRQRLVAGIVALGLGVGVPILTSVVLVAATGDPAFVIFPLPFLGAVWIIQGLAPTGFTLEDRALRVERRWMARRVPYSTIRGVDRTPRPIGGLLALGLNGLFGSHGPRWRPGTGLHYLAITNTRDLVYLDTAIGLVVISPSEPDAFVAELRRRLGLDGADPSTNGHGPQSPNGSPRHREP